MGSYDLVDMTEYQNAYFLDRFPVYNDLLIVAMTLREFLRYEDFTAPELQGFGEYMRESLDGIIRCCAVVVTSKYRKMPIKKQN